MNFLTTFITIIEGILAVIGIVSLFHAGYLRLGQLLPIRRFLGFGINTPLDIIITTSDIKKSTKGLKIIRATTGIGQIQGIAYLSKFFVKNFRKKEISTHISKNVSQKPENDLILLGGPSKNEYSGQFIKILKSQHPDLQLSLNENSGRLRLKNKTYTLSNTDLQNGLPKKDIALVIVWKNPFSENPRKAIYCAGMTSYGTSGSINWLFNDVLTLNKKTNKKVFKIVGKKNPNFIAVIEMNIVNDYVVSTIQRKIILLNNNKK